MRAFVLGLIAGAGLMLAGLVVSGDWYEYRMLDHRDDAAGFISNSGWQVVPAQPDELYLRRPRLRLH